MERRGAANEAPGSGEPFGACLRRLRREAGLSQEELALRAGLSPNAVSSLERSQRKRPYPHTVRSLAEALGLREEERAALLASVPGRGEEVPGASEAPPVSPASSPFTPATSLVGRKREVEELVEIVSSPEVRLITLTGIGGVGKTRLAAEVSRRVSGKYPEDPAFIGLASLSDPSLFAPTVIHALVGREAEGSNPNEALRLHLADRRVLLVLDNFEQLLPASPEVAALVEACPNLTVLTTSRAPLRVRGEHEYPVQPLDLPASTRSPSGADVAKSPSGRLFLERARAARPDFDVTPANASDIAAICWRLAGLPLALELAAAKVRFLDPAALLSRLDRALSTAWARDLPERQQTMRAALDWSHDLLPTEQRALFRRLSVFSGGFTLEAAEAVGGEEALDHLALSSNNRSLSQRRAAAGCATGCLSPSGSTPGNAYRRAGSLRQPGADTPGGAWR